MNSHFCLLKWIFPQIPQFCPGVTPRGEGSCVPVPSRVDKKGESPLSARLGMALEPLEQLPGQGRDSGMLGKPSSSDPSFMGDKNPTLGSVLAEIPALDPPHTQGSAGGSGILQGQGIPFPPWHIPAAQTPGCREELQLKCTIQDSHSFVLL